MLTRLVFQSRFQRFYSTIPREEHNKVLQIYNDKMKYLTEKKAYLPSLAIYEKIKEDGIRPSAATFNLMLNTCFKAGGVHLERIDGILAEMVRANRPRGIFIYTTLIDGYSRTGQFEKVEWVHREYRLSKTEAGITYYNAYIKFCFVSKQFDKITEVLEEIKKRNLKWDAHTITTLISGYNMNGQLERGREIYFEMKRSKKYEIGAATYTSIIKSYMENKDETSAKMVWDSIDRTKEKVDVHLYTSGIRLHLGLRDTHTVLTLFKEMKEKKILFDEKIYQLYLRTMFVVKAYDKIEPTIQAMRNDPAVTFSHYVYNQIIQGYCLAGMMRESEHYLEEMKHNGLAPDRITFKFLQIGYQIIGDIETAKKMRVELKNLTKGRENQ